MVGKSVSISLFQDRAGNKGLWQPFPHVTSMSALGLAELVKTKTVPLFLFCFVLFLPSWGGIKKWPCLANISELPPEAVAIQEKLIFLFFSYWDLRIVWCLQLRFSFCFNGINEGKLCMQKLGKNSVPHHIWAYLSTFHFINIKPGWRLYFKYQGREREITRLSNHLPNKISIEWHQQIFHSPININWTSIEYAASHKALYKHKLNLRISVS